MTEVLKEPHQVKIRKDHICQGCGKKLLKGEEAFSSSYADGGEAWTFYECPDCREFSVNNCQTCEDADFTCIGINYPIGRLKECRKERER